MSGTMSRVLLDARFTDKEVQDGKLVYIFDKKQHTQTLLHNLIVMQDNDEGSLTDVIISSKDNEQFQFHGPILAALGKKLEEHLVQRGLGTAASKNSKIVLKENFSSEAIQCLWDYAYTSVVTLTPANISEVKELAEHHGIESLKRECELLEDEEFDEDTDGVELKFVNLPKFILNGLCTLLSASTVCSATITSSDSFARIPCHGAILAAASSEFACTDTHEDLQVSDATTFQVISSFLRYLYTAKLMVDPGTVQQLLEMAVEFNMPSIGHACCCWLKDALTADNVLGIMSIVQHWQAKVQDQNPGVVRQDSLSLYETLEDLYQSARSLALMDFLNVKDSEDFLDLSLEELIDLIIDDNLVVDSEEDVFYAVMKWVEFDPETRGVELPNLLQSVRLEHMSVGFLYTIKEHDLVKTNPHCVEVIEKALKDILQQNYPDDYGGETGEGDTFQVSEGTEYFMPHFCSKVSAPVDYEPIFSSPNRPQSTPEFNLVSEPIPFDAISLPRPYDGNTLLETSPVLPRKPDMRLRRNREAFLERGKNLDGTPDKRLKENKNKNKKSTVNRKLTYPDEDLPRRKDGQLDRRFEAVREFERENLALSSEVPRRKDGKPDMRFKVNKMKANKENGENAKLKLLPEGPTRKDGKPDMRFKANRFPSKAILCNGPTRKDGQPDMRYAANKQKVNIEYLIPENNASTKGPKKKDGSLDMRYAENKKAAAASGPLKKDGTLDMRFAVNKLPSDSIANAVPCPLKKDGSPDMRFAVNKGYSVATPTGPLKNNGTPDMRYRSNRTSADVSVRESSGQQNSSCGPLKKDGTPDMRYRSNKSSSFGSGCSSIGGSFTSMPGSFGSPGACGPLKKDGTPDMRYSSNKSSTSSSFGSWYPSFGGSCMSTPSSSFDSFGSSRACGPLKKDGTPDMRYRSNKSSSSSSFGSGCSSIGGSFTSMPGSSFGSFGFSGACGPLKKDGTPDMRYRSNKGSSFGSGSSLSSGWSTSSFSSGYSGSSNISTSSGPLKKDGTPDMRYKANRR